MQTVEVRFKGNRKGFFSWGGEAEPLRLQEAVIVEAERGFDLGRVNSVGDTAAKKCAGCGTSCGTGESAAKEAPVVRAVSRRANQEEIRTSNELRKGEEDVRRKVIERVKEHQLAMKVSDAEWQWDRNKLTIYFTAEKRVDFRTLVRDLASLFRTRIELRQIGVRDEAARLTGVGRCGREYCCSTWLTELSPVNLSLAKDQHLSLNPQQISGGCGRLLCCLKYEHDFYVASRKRFPKEGKTLKTAVGPEKVVAVDIFRERVFLRHEEQGPRIISLVQLREEMDRAGEPLVIVERVAPLPREPVEPPPAPSDAGEAQPSRSRRRRRGRRGRGRPPSGPTTNPAPDQPSG
jgi:cell fate regulator YaaT (PSP1 superfamily)